MLKHLSGLLAVSTLFVGAMALPPLSGTAHAQFVPYNGPYRQTPHRLVRPGRGFPLMRGECDGCLDIGSGLGTVISGRRAVWSASGLLHLHGRLPLRFIPDKSSKAAPVGRSFLA